VNRALHISPARRCTFPPPFTWNRPRGAIVMSDPVRELVKAHLKQLRLPAMARELERLSREAAASDMNYEQFLLRLAEAGLAARATNALETRIKNAAFPVAKDFDTFDFAAMPTLSRPKILELATCEWIDQKFNCCFIGNTGTGKTHLATGLGLAACRRGLRVRFFTAAALVSKLEQAQKQYTLDKFLGQLDRAELLICDELGYVSFSRNGVELLFRLLTDRYERSSVLITSNLAFADWAQVFQGERMTAALLDRMTHRCHIVEMNGESYRFRESMKAKKGRKTG
jgi:DNA replication protein DnaC